MRIVRKLSKVRLGNYQQAEVKPTPFPGRGETVGGRAPSRVGPSWARRPWSVSIGNVSKARRESRPRGARAGRWPGHGRGLLLASRLL